MRTMRAIYFQPRAANSRRFWTEEITIIARLDPCAAEKKSGLETFFDDSNAYGNILYRNSVSSEEYRLRLTVRNFMPIPFRGRVVIQSLLDPTAFHEICLESTIRVLGSAGPKLR